MSVHLAAINRSWLRVEGLVARRPAIRRRVVVALWVINAGLLVAGLLVSISMRERVAVDAFTYLAAGERLADGHELYRLLPTDRPVVVTPPYWTAPFLSPPFLAVAWTPLAVLGEVAAYGWWAGSVVATLAALVWLARSVPIRTGLMALALFGGTITTLQTGNINGYLLMCLVLVWVYRAHPLAGVLAGLMTAVKLTPGALFGFMLHGPRAVLAAGLVAITGALLVGLVGTDFATHRAYLGVATSVVPYPHSLSGLSGIPILSPLVFAACAIAASLVPSARWSFVLAVVGIAIGSPTAHLGSWTLLIAALAPFAFPEKQLLPAGDEP